MDIHNEGNWHLDSRADASVEVRGHIAGDAADGNEASALGLDESGAIRELSESCVRLFGYAPNELAGQHISALYPQLSGFRIFSEGRFNPMLRFLCHCGHPFEARNKQGGSFLSELAFASAEDSGRRSLTLIVRPLRNGHRHNAI